MTPSAVLLANLAFFAFASAVLLWARWRTLAGPDFPGPQPVGPIFKAWLVVIWAVGLLLPLAAIVVDGVLGGEQTTLLALLPYFAAFVAQVATEIYIWKRWRSPVWVIVPCLYLPWRLFQVWIGFDIVGPDPQPLTGFTLLALFALWAINIGVHYTNIVNTLRWSAHPPDSNFAALRDPRVFVKDQQ